MLLLPLLLAADAVARVASADPLELETAKESQHGGHRAVTISVNASTTLESAQEQARAAVRPADVVRAHVEPAVHGVSDGAEAQAPAGTSRTLGRPRAALGGAHVRRCWGQPGCRMRFS